MRNFFIFFALVFATLTSYAQQWKSGTLAAGVNDVIPASGFLLNSIQINNTTAGASVVTLYDANNSTNRITPGYTGYTVAPQNVTKTWVSNTGVTNTITVPTLVRTETVVNASTNEAPRMYRITVPANGSVVFEPTSPLGGTFGLTILSDTAGSYNLSYRLLP